MDREVEVLQSLADPTRLRLIHLLERKGEICVCELVDALGVPQYNVSRHLRVLQNAGWLEDRRQGRWVYYRLTRSLKPYQRSLLEAVAQLRAEREDLTADEVRAGRRLRLRQDGVCCVGLVSQIGPARAIKSPKFNGRKAGKNR
jgi:ArsR family transcriptional regulator, arsenate/arsenite/antimonite-responsive transcriptional repressor